MLSNFGNNWIQKIPLTAKSSEYFSSNYFQIGQHVVILHIRCGYNSVFGKVFGSN